MMNLSNLNEEEESLFFIPFLLEEETGTLPTGSEDCLSDLMSLNAPSLDAFPDSLALRNLDSMGEPLPLSQTLDEHRILNNRIEQNG